MLYADILSHFLCTFPKSAPSRGFIQTSEDLFWLFFTWEIPISGSLLPQGSLPFLGALRESAVLCLSWLHSSASFGGGINLRLSLLPHRGLASALLRHLLSPAPNAAFPVSSPMETGAKTSDQADVAQASRFLSHSYLCCLHWLWRSESQMSPDDLLQAMQTLSSWPESESLAAWRLAASSFCQLPECVLSGASPAQQRKCKWFLLQCQHTYSIYPLMDSSQCPQHVPSLGRSVFSQIAQELETVLVLF